MRARRDGGNAGLTCGWRRRIALTATLAGGLLGLAAQTPALAQADNPISFAAAQSIESGHTNLALSCPAVTLCVAGDSGGFVLASTDPGAPGSTWTPVQISAAASSIDAISCPSSTFCVAVDQVGDAYTSQSPAAATSASWIERPGVAAGDTLAGVSCASTSICVAVGDDGAYISTNAGASWAAVSALAGPPGFDAVSCPSADLCVAVGDHTAITLTNLGAGGSASATADVAADLPNRLTDVACLSSSTCVGVDNGAPNGNAILSSNLATSTWNAPQPTSSAGALTAITCPLTSFCVAVDSGGDASFLSDPPGAAPTWTLQGGFDPAGSGFSAVSCPQTGLCVALDQSGGAALGTGALLNVALAGAGGGTITDSDSYLSCGLQCAAYYAGGSSVTLTATAGAGSTFAGWSGAGCSGLSTCTLINGAAGSAQTVTAHFTPPPPHTTITKAKIQPKRRTAKFSFKATESAAKFQCALVHSPAKHKHRPPSYHPCRYSKAYKHMKAGGYEFFVRGIGPGGTDPAPATFAFRIP